MIKVNPPPQINIPRKFFADPELRSFFEQQQTILFQLWNRTGGSIDNITPLVETSTLGNAITLDPAHVLKLHQRIDENEVRLEDIESALTKKANKAEVFKVHQRIDELIDILIDRLDKLIVGSDAQKAAVDTQRELLRQAKLLNMVTEEAFETSLTIDDIEE